MRVSNTKLALTTLAAAATLGLGACASTAPKEGATPVGRYVVQGKTDRLDAVVGYRYAATHPGSDWLILQFAATSPTGTSTTIPRSGLAVVTPAGDEVPLATQAEVTDAYGTLRPAVNQAEVIRDPMGYFPPNRESCDLDLFSLAGNEVTYDAISLDYHRACAGLLFFKLPAPTAAGRYTLVVRPENGPEVRIPFTL